MASCARCARRVPTSDLRSQRTVRDLLVGVEILLVGPCCTTRKAVAA